MEPNRTSTRTSFMGIRLDGIADALHNIARTMAMYFINTVTLKNEANRVIRQVRATGRAVVVTQRGRPAVAIVPLEEGDLVLRREKEFRKAVLEGLRDIKAGRTVSLKTFAKRHLRRNP